VKRVGIRTRLGLALLVSQALWVAWVHLGVRSPGHSLAASVLDGCSAAPVDCRRDFAWAPNDYNVNFTIRTVVHGHALSKAEAERRYHLPVESGLIQAPAQLVIDTIDHYERTYGRGDHASVTVHYTIDGRGSYTWHRP
jgi:hypothetical protein